VEEEPVCSSDPSSCSLFALYCLSAASSPWCCMRASRENKDSWFRCYGVDTNRNWDFHWGEGGTSPDTCSDIYRGSSPSLLCSAACASVESF